MIEYIKGELTELQPTDATVETAGVGYFLNISLTTYDVLNRGNGQKTVRLFVHEVIREDAHLLYGFADRRERELFRLLISVSGVGANTARVILSAMTPPELEGVLMNGDDKMLKSVKGIGAKTAQRIIVELRDKIKPTDDTLIQQPVSNPEAFEEALAALVALGFARQHSQKVLTKIFKEEPGIRAETAIKRALPLL